MKRLSYLYVKKYVEDLGYQLLSDIYINHKEKISLSCPKGHLYLVSFDAFKRGNRCSTCSGKHLKTTEQFKNDVLDLVGDEYEVLGEYINNKTEITIQHNLCGHIWNVIPNNFISNESRCPLCNGKMKKSLETFKSEVYDLVGDEYSILGDYINTHTKILIKHNLCGNEYLIKPLKFLQGRRCPECSESKGEKKIKDICKKLTIPFDSQYTFSDLIGVGGGLLRFDVPIFWDDKKTKLRMLIEFDGQQHFKWVKWMMSKESFEILKQHDKLKDNYCKNNNINLLRIKYDQYDNIEEILVKNLINNKELEA